MTDEHMSELEMMIKNFKDDFGREPTEEEIYEMELTMQQEWN